MLKVTFIGSFVLALIMSIFLWVFVGYHGAIQAAEALNWMGIFVTSLSLTFAVYIVVLAIDAYSHAKEIRAAQADLQTIRDKQAAVEDAIAVSEKLTTTLASQLNGIRKAQIEFVLRLNNDLIETLYMPTISNQPVGVKAELVRSTKRQSALLVLDHFPDDPSLVMPQIYTLLEVGDSQALLRARAWLVSKDIPEAPELLKSIQSRLSEARSQ